MSLTGGVKGIFSESFLFWILKKDKGRHVDSPSMDPIHKEDLQSTANSFTKCENDRWGPHGRVMVHGGPSPRFNRILGLGSVDVEAKVGVT